MIINYWRSGMILEGENLTYAPESPTGNLFRVSRTGKMWRKNGTSLKRSDSFFQVQ